MPVDVSKLDKERFTGTKIYDYDQITSVSQRGINNQFNLIFQKSDAKLRRFTTNTTDDDDWTQIVDAELAPPVLELLLGTDEKQTALFTLKLTTGTFKYLNGPIRKPIEETAHIKDWTVAFDVRFSLNAVKDQDVPKRVKDASRNISDYVVHEFIVDYSSVDLSKYDENRSIIGLPTDRAKNSFVTSIGLYLTKPGGILHSAVYYLLTRKNPAIEHLPGHSILPTNSSFQNLPFVTSSLDQGTKNSDDNMLVYLQMTEGRALPKNLLPFPSANWVVPSPNPDPNERYDGTIGLSERVFFTLLSLFNQHSTWVAESVTKDSSGQTPVIKGHCGYVDNELPAKGVLWGYDSKNSTPSSRKYVYTQRSTTKPSTDVPLAFQDGLTQNKVEVPVGLDENGICAIKLEGKTEVVTAIAGLGTAIQSGTWSGELVLDSSSRKDLKITLKVTRHVAETIFDEEVRALVQPFKESLERSLERLSSDEFKTLLTQWLTGTWKFVFPSYGEFVIKEAAFNSEGDLLMKIVQKL